MCGPKKDIKRMGQQLKVNDSKNPTATDEKKRTLELCSKMLRLKSILET